MKLLDTRLLALLLLVIPLVAACGSDDDDDSGEPIAVSVALLRDEGWEWHETSIDFSSFPSLTAAGAGDWLVVFSADQAPVVIHLPSGAWQRNTQGPLSGVEAQNTVWTGDQLIIWGGVKADAASPNGARWAPSR